MHFLVLRLMISFYNDLKCEHYLGKTSHWGIYQKIDKYHNYDVVMVTSRILCDIKLCFSWEKGWRVNQDFCNKHCLTRDFLESLMTVRALYNGLTMPGQTDMFSLPPPPTLQGLHYLPFRKRCQWKVNFKLTFRRRCDVMTSRRRWYVIFRLYVLWVTHQTRLG